jgi:hypothetical protein
MATLEVTTCTGDAVALESVTIAAFQALLRGPVLCPSDAGYEAARTIWNAHILKRPALIVRCRGVADVLASVHFARTHQLFLDDQRAGRCAHADRASRRWREMGPL